MPSIAGKVDFREAMYDTLNTHRGARGGTGVSPPGSHSLPLMRFVLHHTAEPGSGRAERYLEGWTRLSMYALSRRNRLSLVDGSVAADAAMCDDWLGRLNSWLEDWRNLAKVADEAEGCHYSWADRLQEAQGELGSEAGAAGSRGASAVALVCRHVEAAWQSLVAAEEACRGEILCTLGEVKVWSPCAAGEDHGSRDKEEAGAQESED